MKDWLIVIFSINCYFLFNTAHTVELSWKLDDSQTVSTSSCGRRSSRLCSVDSTQQYHSTAINALQVRRQRNFRRSEIEMWAEII